MHYELGSIDDPLYCGAVGASPETLMWPLPRRLDVWRSANIAGLMQARMRLGWATVAIECVESGGLVCSPTAQELLPTLPMQAAWQQQLEEGGLAERVGRMIA